MSDAREAKLKTWLKRGVFSLVPVAVLLAGAELLAKFAIEREVRTTTDAVSGQSVYSMRIGRLPWSRESLTPLNSQGFPDIEFANVTSRDECVHVVFVGDSFVFGDGVDPDSSFVGLVRTWSASRVGGRCVRVFNLGERGTTLDRQAENVRATMSQLRPDIVILGQYQNDLTDLTNTRPTADMARTPRAAGGWTNVRERFGSFNLNVVRFISYRAFGSAIQRDIEWDLLTHWSVMADSSRRETATRLMGEYEALYASMAAELAEHGVGFGVVIIPSKFDILGGRFPEEEFFLDLARKYDVPFLRVFPVLDERRSPYAFLMYDGHLNELGNRLVAQAVFEWLYDAEPAPFPDLRRGY